MLTIFLTFYYGMFYGKIKSYTWIIYVLLTVFFLLLIINPIHIFFVTVIQFVKPSSVANNENQNDFIIEPKQSEISKLKLEQKEYVNSLDHNVYKPIPIDQEPIVRIREKTILRHRDTLADLYMFATYLSILILIVLGSRDFLCYYSSREVHNQLFNARYQGTPIENVLTQREFLAYLNNSLLLTLHNGVAPNGKPLKNAPGWLSGKSIKLIGVFRMRQHRVVSSLCPRKWRIPNRTECYEEFRKSSADRRNYDPGWKPYSNFLIQEFPRTLGPWIYQDWRESKSMPCYGSLATYPGGGYISNLGRSLVNSRKILNYLQNNSWFDGHTRVVIIEGVLYGIDANIFNIVQLIAEQTVYGTYKLQLNIRSLKLMNMIEFQSTVTYFIFIVFLLLICIYFLRILMKLWRNKIRKFFSKIWNVIDTIIVTVTVICLVLYFKRNEYVLELLHTLEESQNNTYVSFGIAAFLDDCLSMLSGFVVCLATVRVWKILKFALLFRILNKSIYRAFRSLSSITMVIIIFLTGFGICNRAINGTYSEQFTNLIGAISSLTAMSFGYSTHIRPEDLMHGGVLLGMLFYVLEMIFINLILLNIFITIACLQFTEVSGNIKDEERIFDEKSYTFFQFIKDEIKFIFNGGSTRK